MNRTLLGKLIRLRPRDWGDLLAAQAALVRAQLLVWRRPRGALLTPVPVPEPAGAASAREHGIVQRVAVAVSRAARYGGFRPSCLVRAVALHGMLQARGFSGSSLRVGVRRENGRFLAHAWVEYRGSVLADQAWHVQKFDELARMGLGPAS